MMLVRHRLEADAAAKLAEAPGDGEEDTTTELTEAEREAELEAPEASGEADTRTQPTAGDSKALWLAYVADGVTAGIPAPEGFTEDLGRDKIAALFAPEQ